MDPSQIRVGLKVYISSNIDFTTEKLNSNEEMEDMAGNGQKYKILSILDLPTRGIVAKIGNYTWMPQDLINANKEYLDPVALKGKKVTFDPYEL